MLASFGAAFCCNQRRNVANIIGGGDDVQKKIPPVLQCFLKARDEGDADLSASCCSQDIRMRGPMGEFSGLEAVKERAFGKKSQPVSRELMPLSCQPQMCGTASAFANDLPAASFLLLSC